MLTQSPEALQTREMSKLYVWYAKTRHVFMFQLSIISCDNTVLQAWCGLGTTKHQVRVGKRWLQNVSMVTKVTVFVG